jgi:hypothetical protein
MTVIQLSIEYYNETQQHSFRSFPNIEYLDNIVKNGIAISKDEFLAYMMFTEQMERDGFRTYTELQNRIQRRLGDIEDFLSFNNSSIQSKFNGIEMMQAGFTERIGVALGLCVINKIHRLTAADWKKIPEVPGKKGHPTLDFELPVASTGTSFIQVENKGSVTENNNRKGSSIQNHYNKIQQKKSYVRQQEADLQIPIYKNLYYGTIGILDGRTDSKAKVLLIDPPAFEIDMEHSKYKLIARLRYYLDEFNTIGIKETITRPLENRISEIMNSDNYLNYSNIPLVSSRFSDSVSFYLNTDSNTEAIVDTNEAFGRFYEIESEEKPALYVIAFTKAILRMIIRQDFDGVLNYTYEPNFINENVTILLRSKEPIEQFMSSEEIRFRLNERGKGRRRYYEATYYGRISHDSSGRIFGIIK